MTTTSSEPPPLYAVIPTLARWIRLLFGLHVTKTFNGWRDEDEPVLLFAMLKVALERAENLKALPEPFRSERLTLLWNDLPHARLKQILGDRYAENA